MKKISLLAVAGVASLLFPGAALAHGGPPAVVFTDVVTGTNTSPFAGPCGAAPGEVTTDFRDVFHVTEFEDGHVNVHFNQVGTFAFEPTDENEPSSSGRYRQSGHTVISQQDHVVDTFAFTVVGRDENGDKVKFQIKQTFVFANGEIRVDNMSVGCG